MGNTKAIGVAYADPDFEAVTATNISATGTITAAGAVTGRGIVSTALDGMVASNGNARIAILGSAITANVTTTTFPAGSLGITTNATGIGKLFYSDGTKWQFMAVS